MKLENRIIIENKLKIKSLTTMTTTMTMTMTISLQKYYFEYYLKTFFIKFKNIFDIILQKKLLII